MKYLKKQILYNQHNFPQDAVEIRSYIDNEASSLPVREKENTEHQPEVERKNIIFTLVISRFSKKKNTRPKYRQNWW